MLISIVMEMIISPFNLKAFSIKAFFTTKPLNGNPTELFKNIGISENNIYLPIQKHTGKVMMLENDLSPVIADAVITKRKNILIGIQVADCVPMLLYDKQQGVAGAVHAGWRGTAEGILKNTIKLICDRFHSVPEDIMVAFGPSIRWCCYNVGYEVLAMVMKSTGSGDYYKKKNDIFYIDLATANKYQAISMGIPEENLWISQECTHCNPDRFYSYRYTKGPTGRQGGFIGIFQTHEGIVFERHHFADLPAGRQVFRQ
ncbi:MAG: peptidoglycan editing factor PgeF [Nitrospirae bacterium]|nr:peptidoglycan editing factor PgeF [Nitrospirota bacterium]